MSPAAPAQVRVPVQKRVRQESRPKPRFTVVTRRSSTPSWLLNPMVLGPMVLAATLAFIVAGYGVLTQRQMALTTINAQVQSESLAHDKALLKVETMQSPLRITSEEVAANRLVPPAAIVEVQAVSLDTPVRTISYVYEPKFVAPVGIALAPTTIAASAPVVPSSSPTGTVPVSEATSTPPVQTASGALPPTVGQ